MKPLLFTLLFMVQWASAQTPALQFALEYEMPLNFPVTPQAMVKDAAGKPYAYLAAKAGGLRVYDLGNPAQPVLVKTLPVSMFNALEVMHMSARGTFLYLALGNFFGENDVQAPGLSVVDVADPLNPVVRDVWAFPETIQGSGSVTVSGNYAYLCAMRGGMFILDIAIPDDIKEVSRVVPDKNFPLPNPDDVHEPRARSVALRDDVAYLCYDAGGLRVIDVSDKAHPVETGRYINPVTMLPAGKQQAFNSIVLDGNLAYVAVDYCGMEVLDISDTAHITQKGWWNPWQCQAPTNLWVGSPGHTNQMAFDAAHQLVYMASGQSELNAVSVAHPEAPTAVGSYGATDNGIGTWGMMLDGERVYLLYIVSIFPFGSNWAGIKVLHRSALNGVAAPGMLYEAQLYPNPFSTTFSFDFQLDVPLEAAVELYDVSGTRVYSWPQKWYTAGKQQLRWLGDLPEGIYWLQVRSSQGVWLEKMCRGMD